VTATSRAHGSTELYGLVGVTIALSITRFYAAAHVGFGDSEALYACYALHPQPAYLDHPGFVGLLARILGAGRAPTPETAHLATTALAAIVPWIVALACVACGAAPRRAFAAALVVAVVPEIAIGLFALTPDLPLALSWTGALACAAIALRAPPRSWRALLGFAAAGVLAGVAVASKASGALLPLALAATYASAPARAHARSIAPWAGLVACAIVALPLARFEAQTGWPMLRHRLVDTQADAGITLRNIGALIAGQLLYLSPMVAAMAGMAGAAAFRQRKDGAIGRLLFFASVLPAAVLVPLCLWSRVAEPHWLAPAFLALPLVAARSAPGIFSRRLVGIALATSAALVAGVYAWVLLPASPGAAPAAYDARIDIANELYGWPDVIRGVRAEIAGTPTVAFGDVAVVGPHWVICAQLEAALEREVPVGCNTRVPDDFDAWWPRSRWRDADTILWVSDTRFGPPPAMPWHTSLGTRTVAIERGGRVVRTFTITTLSRRGQATARTSYVSEDRSL
jgi:hypothetical protein